MPIPEVSETRQQAWERNVRRLRNVREEFRHATRACYTSEEQFEQAWREVVRAVLRCL